MKRKRGQENQEQRKSCSKGMERKGQGQGNMEQRKSSSQGTEKDDKETRNRENQVVKEQKKRIRKRGTEKTK